MYRLIKPFLTTFIFIESSEDSEKIMKNKRIKNSRI